MTTATVPARRLHASHVFVAYALLLQHDLPAPTSLLVEDAGGGRTHVTLTVDTVGQVDGWAEAMGVEVDSTLHNDGTWTDEATGRLEVLAGRRNRWTESVEVTVHSPQVTTAHPVGGFADGHTHLAASGQEQVPCPDPGRCAEQAAELDCGELHPGESGAQVADRIIGEMARRNGAGVQL